MNVMSMKISLIRFLLLKTVLLTKLELKLSYKLVRQIRTTTLK